MNTVAEILDAKGGDVWSVAPEDSVFDALQLMDAKNIGALVVLDGEKVVGIFSERDYARRGILKGKTSKDTKVSEVFTRKVLGVTPERTIGECMALMTDKHIRHLPVLQGRKLVGVISIGDVVKAMISQQSFIIEQLEHYIAGV